MFNVLASPKWIIEPNDVRLSHNVEIDIKCQADGMPKPSIMWKSESNEIFRGEVLRISKNRKDESYECIADNGVGERLRKKIKILISGM